MVEEHESMQFRIHQSTDAGSILQNAEVLGLPDIRKWITKEVLQCYLDLQKWIGYVALSNTPESKILGIALMGIEEEGRLWIEALVTDPLSRRKGIATELCRSMLEYGKKNGSRAIFVDLDNDNPGAFKFYKRFGFENAGRISHFYYDSTTAIILAMKIV